MYDQIDSRSTLEFKDIVEYMVLGDYLAAFFIQKTEQSKDDSRFPWQTGDLSIRLF